MLKGKMKISGFAQLRNEHEKGNLTNWFRCMNAVCDNIFIYDQNSTDGSLEEYRKCPNVKVIESPINDFENEIKCKDELLKFLKKESPDTDWIFWMDGDTVLEQMGLKNNYVQKLCQKFNDDPNVEALIVGHYNLWRSNTFYRVDNLYHWLHEHGVYALWKNSDNLKFDLSSGLHKPQMPVDPSRGVKVNLSLIHMGFSQDEQIVSKYLNYREKGMTGYHLDRLLDEETLTVEPLPLDMLPDWIIKDLENPINKQKLLEKYNDRIK